MKVVFFFRKKLPQFHSIEGVFNGVIHELGKVAQAERVEVPYEGAGPRSIIGNLSFTHKHKGGINHITGHVNYLAMVTGRKTVLTVHDIGSAFYGNALHRFLIKTFWFWIPALLVKRITVISEFTRQELYALIPFAKHKIRVVHNPVSPEIKEKAKIFNSSIPLILLIGTKTNKNLERTLEALQGIPCSLLILGQLTEPQLKLLAAYNLEYENKFAIPYSEVLTSYKKCDLLCFASTYEGFGMPIIEAQAVGRPVLTSNLGVMPEVAGKGACFVDPLDVRSIREGVLKIINNETCREELVTKGLENVKRFRVEKIAEDYLAVYKEVLEE
ncbi:glycosyltransferase family 4 protein [Flavobacteriaceae bacterium F89]|uniref:Glycosyltransferase family 4 protein n=1 Tax=Cerina litoralis TaxID=2874477 RepID=A0AAE3JSK6_9FLAO|nr:glycosyltransferase family 1 protein [Cerina litoralis]MCG2462613.1 glycosyltransferase family 4 protein [Cerina litoralis]